MGVDYTNGRYTDTAASQGNAPIDAAADKAKWAEAERQRAIAAYKADNDRFSSNIGGGYTTTAPDIYKPQTYPGVQSSGGSDAGGLSNAQKNWNSALDLTQGRGDATMNDPRVSAALDLLQQHTKEGPYTDQVVNQQANRMADRTAAAAGNQADALRSRAANSGGNVNDPSYQAAMNQANTGRMQQNNADRGDLESSATLNNYREQGNAAGQLGSMRMGQLGMANNQYNQAAQLYANQQQTSGHTNALGNGNQGQPQNFNYQTPQYNPQDWSAVIDAINGGSNSTQSAPAQTPASNPDPYGQGGIHPAENPHYTADPNANMPGHSADDYTGAAAQNWAASQGNQGGNNANDYTGQAAQDWSKGKGGTRALTLKPIKGAAMPYTYNPSDMR